MARKPIVFISYRTDDSEEFAKDLQHFLQYPLELEVRLGNDTLLGEEWQTRIPQLILDSDIFIAIIGAKWAVGAGNRNIDDTEDVVRKEVELGLEKVRRFGVVTLDDFKLKADELPPSLKRLPDLQWAHANSDFKKGDGVGKLTATMHRICDELQPKPIVLLSSTLAFLGNSITTDGLTYFVTLVVSLVHTLMGDKHEVILKVPPYGGKSATKTAADFQHELLREIVDEYKRYSGIIIAPFETEKLCEEIHKLWRKDDKFPIVTIDKIYPTDYPYFKDRGVKSPPGVACDGRHNGGLAAKCVIDYLDKAKIPKPNVVILQGLEGSEPRILGFVDKIKHHNSNADEEKQIHVSVSDEMPFLSSEASNKAESYLRPDADWDELNDGHYGEMLKDQPQKRRGGVDVFFCCNDEMALGVCERLEHELREKRVLHATVVVGFDGIPEVNRRISDNDHWLLNTIDVKLRGQVDELVKHFIPAIRDHKSVGDPELVKGRLVLSDQYDRVKSILKWRSRVEKRLEGRRNGGRRS